MRERASFAVARNILRAKCRCTVRKVCRELNWSAPGGYRVHWDSSLLNVNRQSVNRRLFHPFRPTLTAWNAGRGRHEGGTEQTAIHPLTFGRDWVRMDSISAGWLSNILSLPLPSPLPLANRNFSAGEILKSHNSNPICSSGIFFSASRVYPHWIFLLIRFSYLFPQVAICLFINSFITLNVWK